MADMQEPGQMEEDWLYMKQLYPNTARKLMTYIEDAADRLEYENSLMFDAYPDRIAVSSEKRIGFSTLKVSKPEKYIVEELEYHKTTWEMFMPLNDDAVLHTAPKSGGDVVTELTEAFIVPKGTMVKLDAAVWHLAAMPVNVEELQSLIVLPEGTYMNDCTKVALNDEQKFEIVI